MSFPIIAAGAGALLGGSSAGASAVALLKTENGFKALDYLAGSPELTGMNRLPLTMLIASAAVLTATAGGALLGATAVSQLAAAIL